MGKKSNKHENHTRDGSRERNGWKAERKQAGKQKRLRNGEFVSKPLLRAIGKPLEGDS